MGTSFTEVYDNFFSKIVDDMYMELTEQDTKAMLKDLLINATFSFEFPRQNLHDYDLELERFACTLTLEEINILGTYMVVEWIGQQLAHVDNTRMKYSGSDFKFTSQANHMTKLIQLKKEYKTEGFHLQRLYKRRKADKNGIMQTTLNLLVSPK